MAKSIKQIQDEVLSEGFLNRYEQNKTDFLGKGEAPITEFLIAEAAANFALKAIKNLNDLGKTDTGELETSLSVGEVIKVGNASYEVSLGYPDNSKAAQYFDFVDKGVQGVKSKAKAPTSPYSFRKLSAPPVMVEAIKGWARRQNLGAITEDQPRNLSALQRKKRGTQKSIKEQGLDRFAYNAARKIKREGLPTTRYFSSAIDEFFGKAFVDAVAKSIGADIRIYIRQVQRG